jgi:predicted amino acid racemase
VNRLIIDLEVMRHNLGVVNNWMERHNAGWTLVTKVLCGHAETLKALKALGVRSVADSRLDNLRLIGSIKQDLETWYLRVPDLSSVDEVVTLADVSLNSEIEVIEALNREAKRQNKIHRVIIMIELGDLREGILPGTLTNFYEEVFELPNIEVLGIGANIGCLAGVVPNVDQYMQLILYRELLELKFHEKLPMISAGSTAVLPLVLDGQLPRAINHFRIGEAVFLGTDLINGGTLPGLRNDVMLLEAEIAEIKEKGLVPFGETSSVAPFEIDNQDDTAPGQRGYRALLSIGELDTDIAGLTPIDADHKIAGASSDLTVVNLGDDPGGLKIGDTIKFRVNYSALLRLMAGKYVEKELRPPLSMFGKLVEGDELELKPTVVEVGEEGDAAS